MKTTPTLTLILAMTLQQASASEAGLLALSAGHFKDTATVSEDLNAGTATISSERGYSEHTGLLRMVWNDEFLTGIVDRKTGQHSFRISTLVIYTGEVRNYETAEYSAGGGQRSVSTQALRMQKECGDGSTNCTYTERVSFPVDEDTLRSLALREGDRPVAWHYKLMARKGVAYSGVLSTAEIAGFLAKVDEVTNTGPVARPQTVKTSLHDLGVQGIAITANAEQPTRVGVLIASVKSGSVAQKAGIITGDILYQVGGSPTRTVAELEAAVAASAVDVPISIRLMRGLSDETHTMQF